MNPKEELTIMGLSILSIAIPVMITRHFIFNVWENITFEQYLLQSILLAMGYFLFKDIYKKCYRFMKYQKKMEMIK